MSKMKVSVVITTIHPFEKTSIPRYCEVCSDAGWELIVVGDKKTPDMNLPYGTYLSPRKQAGLPFRLAKLLPWNCYERKNIGYLFAKVLCGSDVIISTDDDNYPLDNYTTIVNHFGKNTARHTLYSSSSSQFANPLPFFSDHKSIWPRGLPHRDVGNYRVEKYNDPNDTSYVNVVASLWNGSPDFDAIGHACFDHIDWKFKTNKKLFKHPSVLAPYNTQNTAFSASVLERQLLIPGLARATDIWTSYISQCTQYDPGVLFVSPTVYQKRNVHSYDKDLRDELLVFTQTDDLVQSIGSGTRRPYRDTCTLLSHVMPTGYMKFVDAWLGDLHG